MDGPCRSATLAMVPAKLLWVVASSRRPIAAENVGRPSFTNLVARTVNMVCSPVVPVRFESVEARPLESRSGRHKVTAPRATRRASIASELSMIRGKCLPPTLPPDASGTRFSGRIGENFVAQACGRRHASRMAAKVVARAPWAPPEGGAGEARCGSPRSLPAAMFLSRQRGQAALRRWRPEALRSNASATAGRIRRRTGPSCTTARRPGRCGFEPPAGWTTLRCRLGSIA